MVEFESELVCLRLKPSFWCCPHHLFKNHVLTNNHNPQYIYWTITSMCLTLWEAFHLYVWSHCSQRSAKATVRFHFLDEDPEDQPHSRPRAAVSDRSGICFPGQSVPLTTNWGYCLCISFRSPMAYGTQHTLSPQARHLFAQYDSAVMWKGGTSGSPGCWLSACSTRSGYCCPRHWAQACTVLLTCPVLCT